MPVHLHLHLNLHPHESDQEERALPRPPTSNTLLRLARAWGIQTAYYDVDHKRRHAHPDVLLAVLRTLGAPIRDHTDVANALSAHEDARARPGIEPVHVAWDGVLPPLRGRLPGDIAVTCRLELEDGALHEWTGTLSESTGNGEPRWRTGLPRTVPVGYHTLELDARSAAYRTWIISAPRRAYGMPEPYGWGLFLPLYAAHSGQGANADYTDLRALAQWTGGLGGALFGTLPLLATFLAEPFEPSPYAPASRLFWNDFYIDVDRLPGAEPDPRLDEVRGELERCGKTDVVDYRHIAALKRRIIDHAAQRCFSGPAEPSIARDYARFRAVCDRRRQGWHDWPDRLRKGDIRDGDFDPHDERYHLYAAWVAERQLAEAAASPLRGEQGGRREGGDGSGEMGGGHSQPTSHLASPNSRLPSLNEDQGRLADGQQQRAARLYLDLPLGVHHDGFDSWRWPDLFATGVSAGAPPDTFFPGGQDWGFTPLDPRSLRASGYRYFRDCLRHNARFAGALRLDHVMTLERLFWIPRGFDADQGVYMRYPSDELIAVLTLESVRHRTAIIGEDLGTVSRRIRTAMERHGLHRMFVLQYEATPGDEPARPNVPRSAVASLNTHDMPPFAAWRHRATPAALGRALDGLAASRARCIIVNIEDLWLETRPHNVPGSPSEQNWRRRARLTLDQVRRDPGVRKQLERIAAARNQTG